jgi:hypothetical protein
MRRCLTLIAVLAAALVAGAGCESYEPLPGQYGLVGSELQKIVIVHTQEFFTSGTLDDVAPGKIITIDKPEEILVFLKDFEGYQNTEKVQGGRALTLLFFPQQDPFSRKSLELDENLDVRSGYMQHGEVFVKPGWRTSVIFKQRVLEFIGESAFFRDYLGVKPPDDPEGEGASRLAPQ